MLPKYITTRGELNDAEFKNIVDASKKYFLSKRKVQFTIGNLYKIHEEMFGNVWKWAGKKRKTEKNIEVDKTQIKFFPVKCSAARIQRKIFFCGGRRMG